MSGCLRSCLGKIVTLFLFVVLIFALWYWGPDLLPKVRSRLGLDGGDSPGVVQPSQEIADSAAARYRRLRAGEEGERISLSGQELTSLLRFGPSVELPSGVSDPRVEMENGQIHLSGSVVTEAFPDLPDLGPILGFLPDTLSVTLRGTLVPHGEDDAALVVHRIDAARIPIPGRLIPEILSAFGRAGAEGLPEDAMVIRLPEGLSSIYILSDSLVLTSNR